MILMLYLTLMFKIQQKKVWGFLHWKHKQTGIWSSMSFDGLWLSS